MKLFFEVTKEIFRIIFDKKSRDLFIRWAFRTQDAIKYRIKDAKIKGNVLDNEKLAKKISRNNCNHRKGGVHGIGGAWPEKGDAGQYAVIVHTFINGDTHVRCLRCGKTWKPNDVDYANALLMTTLNTPSKDKLVWVDKDGKIVSTFSFKDNGVAYRKHIENSLL